LVAGGLGFESASAGAKQLAVALRSETDFVAALHPTEEGRSHLAEHEIADGVWTNRAAPVDEPRATQCESDFEGVTLWIHTEGSFMVEASRGLRGRYGFHASDMTMTLAEADGVVSLRVQGHVSPTDADEGAQRRHLEKVEKDARETFDAWFGDGPLELDLQLGTSEWRASVTATDEAGVTQLMKGALALTTVGR